MAIGRLCSGRQLTAQIPQIFWLFTPYKQLEWTKPKTIYTRN
jgi:hypothetical protein